MRIAVTGCLALACLAPAEVARADPFTLATTMTTQGVFRCLGGIVCSGSGTNSVVLGSGANSTTLTFDGVSTTVEVSNTKRPVGLGTFSSTASDGFTFPTRTNPRTAILQFDFRLDATSPVTDSSLRTWFFGPGGGETLRLLQGPSFVSQFLGGGPPGANYTAIVYDFLPTFPAINGVGSTALVADAGVVPEPATMILVAAGLAGIARRRKRTMAI